MADTAAADALNIAGVAPFSSVDWPGMLVATVFLQGCPWDCFYCHNPALIDPRSPGPASWADVLALLDERSGLLDGVVFSGGEPTMQRALAPAMRVARERGFLVGLHTGGAYPALLERALPEVDWVGLDIKTLPERYAEVTGRPRSAERAERALAIVRAERDRRAGSDRPLRFEVRTTVHPAAIDAAGLRRLGDRLADAGVERWALQRFRDAGSRHPLPRGGDAEAAVRLDDVPADRFRAVVIR